MEKSKTTLIGVAVLVFLLLAGAVVYHIVSSSRRHSQFEQVYGLAHERFQKATRMKEALNRPQLDMLWDVYDNFGAAVDHARLAADVGGRADRRLAERLLKNAQSERAVMQSWIARELTDYKRWRSQREAQIILAERQSDREHAEKNEYIVRLEAQVENYVRQTSGENVSAKELLDAHFKVHAEIDNQTPFGEKDILQPDPASNAITVTDCSNPKVYEAILRVPPEPEEQDEVVRARMRYLYRALTILQDKLARQTNEAIHPMAGIRANDGKPVTEPVKKQVWDVYLKRTTLMLQNGSLMAAVEKGEVADADIDSGMQVSHLPSPEKAVRLIRTYDLVDSARNAIYGKLAAKLVNYPKPKTILMEYLNWLCREGHADRVDSVGRLRIDVKPIDLYFHVPDATVRCRIEKEKGGAAFQKVDIVVELKQEVDNAWLPVRSVPLDRRER